MGCTAPDEGQYRGPGNLLARACLHERFSTNPYGWHRWVFDQLAPLVAGGRGAAVLLELGCGAGRLWAENLNRLPEGWAVIGTDLSPGMVGEARRAIGLSSSAAAVSFAVADARAIPFGERAFDAVIANHTLYHVADRPAAFAEIARVLRPGGALCAATNGGDHLRELDSLFAGVVPPRADAVAAFSLENGARQLARFFSRIELRRYEDGLEVTDAGALVDYVRSLLPDPAPAAIEGRLLRARRELERTIAEDGAIRVTKASGLFVARV